MGEAELQLELYLLKKLLYTFAQLQSFDFF